MGKRGAAKASPIKPVKADTRRAVKSRRNISHSMKEETLGKLVEYLRQNDHKIYSTWVYATSEQADQEESLEKESPTWHDTYSAWSVIPRYFHSEVLVEFDSRNQYLTQEKVDLIDAAASGQLKKCSAFLFGFPLDSAFPRKLLKKVVMKKWLLNRGGLFPSRLQRLHRALDPECKVDWQEAIEFDMIWTEEGKVSHIGLKSFGEECRVAIPSSMPIDATWKVKNLHDDLKASLESPDGFSKPTFREIFKKYATGKAAELQAKHFELFNALKMKTDAEELAQEHDDMQAAIVYEVKPDILKTAQAKQVAKAKAKKQPPRANAAVQLKVPTKAPMSS